LLLNAKRAVQKITKAVIECRTGELIRTAHSASPKMLVVAHIVHAIKGGLVKYPQSKSFDHLFDSGVGGLSVAAEIRSLMPQLQLSYAADDIFRN